MFVRNLARLLQVSKRPVRGVDFARNRFTNKGTAFSAKEREYMNVEGMLPPAIETLDDQVERYWEQLNRFNEPINRYQLLRSVQDTNVTLYYAIIIRYLKQTLPIIYTPTVGEACQRYGDLFQKDHGLYIDVNRKESVRKMIQNLRKTNIDVIVITDGSRILGLGDLGVNGIGISIGKCSLYVAAGGVKPARVLPVIMDAGTNNESLVNNPLYLGSRKPRCTDEEFYALLDEFMAAAKEAWPSAVIQFEDFSNNHCFDILERYQNKYRCFNDDIQGTGAVVSAGFRTAVKLSGIPMKEQRVLFFGAGSAATGVAQSIAELTEATSSMTAEEIKKKLYFVDSKGLVAANRGDKLAKHKVAWARTDVPDADIQHLTTLEEVVKYVKPTALVGLGATGSVFTKEIVEFIHSYCPRPIIFPLSNPSSKAEILPSNAYKWTNGDAIVASGSPFPDTVVNGRTLHPSQGNNLYIFPGVGMGCCIAEPPYIPQEVLVAAAACLSNLASPEDLAAGQLYPPIDHVRHVSAEIAVACIQKLQNLGLAKKDLPTNRPDLVKLVKNSMWRPEYRPESYYLSQQLIR
ncbi:putative mitochondrial malic enzyme [Leptomonas pyrrhocoris]|uniref:Putative mitochondrial malic enzyme n=1 Tax=Leptomonas pyrrhocoris TaxID=157538 RepID=A0A0N0VEY4_LEPPY|nr:putative mitochondrial malic enzyme [Leptomonas pyrrhocoris]KPA79101.1 putative mitochondrial malic enzyme [Leptomonas pyrrhocoris]|eukprot:XP_015657540.1 putative mitochondrial malic enzyme [Leptomonas pyrrhocoris]